MCGLPLPDAYSNPQADGYSNTKAHIYADSNSYAEADTHSNSGADLWLRHGDRSGLVWLSGSLKGPWPWQNLPSPTPPSS